MAEQQESEGGVAVANGKGSGSETLTVTDNRTGKTYELPIEDGTITGMDLRQIKTGDDDFGLMSAYTNTASCRSAITYIDGDAGILEYRGYPIEQLCEQATYLEVAYLIVHGQLRGFDPEEVQLLKDMAALREELKACTDEARRRVLSRSLQEKSVGYSLLMERARRKRR